MATSSSGLSLLSKAYGSDDSNDDSNSNDAEKVQQLPSGKLNIKAEHSVASSIKIDSAPVVLYSREQDDNQNFVHDGTKELTTYNPRYEELWTPRCGPENPNVSEFHRQARNTLGGYVETAAGVSEFQFENQRKTFHSYGFAQDPTEARGSNALIVSHSSKNYNKKRSKEEEEEEEDNENKKMTKQQLEMKPGVFESAPLREKDKRKRERNDDSSDVDGYLGPWAYYKNQELVSVPNAEEKARLDVINAKRASSNRRSRMNKEQEEQENRSTLHIDDPIDYLGRSFLHIPQDVDKNLRSEEGPDKCYMPKKLLHTYKGHTKGIQKLELFPVSGHLFLTCSMDSKVKLWEFYKERRCIRTYSGHSQGVRDVSFNRDGTEFLTASFDRFVKLWDTETGVVKSKFTNKKIPYCVVFNPDEDKKDLFVCGTSDKKILCYDTRSGEVVQEYDRHLGSVNSITFVDRNKRIVTTSDDKSIRAWEWDIPVDFKYIADPSMHSMPSVSLSKNGRYLAFQSMDNQIKIMEPNANFRWKNKKVFRGHMVAGYACGMDFSPDMSYVISGDAEGKLCIWDWKTTKLYEKVKAHSQVCMDVKWHPHEASQILSAGYDGVVNLWD